MPLRISLALVCLPIGLPASAQDIAPFRAQEVKPYHAQDVKPNRAQEVKPFRAPEPAAVQPGPSPRRESPAPSSFFGTFGLAVPGVAYSWDNHATQTRTNVVAAGTLTKSSLRVNPDGTYEWNSAWDGRLIRGRWISHRDGILLQGGQEKKDWVMGRLPNPSGSAVVYLYDGNYMTYHGTPKPGGR
ncbi:MAG TPA: hypothetical protein VJ528_03670 [Geothrix sp.]|nr:hypothetical protein [Geothrix sp.]